MAVDIVDDKSEHCIPFILDKIKAHCDYYKQEGTDAPPFFLGLNGIQGAGKTTLVSIDFSLFQSRIRRLNHLMECFGVTDNIVRSSPNI